jgi:hypothetical protein
MSATFQNARMLEALIRYLGEQSMLCSPLKVEDLFVSGTEGELAA